MATIATLQSAIAGYLDRTVADFTVNGVDLCLLAMNQVRQQAELTHDFEFSRKLVTVSVNGTTGGSLDTAVLKGTATPVEVKAIIEMGVFDDNGNLRPVEWTTSAESLERQREENRGFSLRYPSDGEVALTGQARFELTGDTIFLYQKDSTASFTVGLEVYAFAADWTVGSASDVWLTKGQQYIMWQTIVQLNNMFKHFVFRQEGNLPPPQDLAAAGLESLKTWDIFKFEGYRRHGR